MSNRVDFFQAEQPQLTIPGAVTTVLLEGMLCPWLEVVEIIRSPWPDFSWARLSYNSAAYIGSEAADIENIERIVGMRKTVCIRQVYNALAPGSGADGITIFAGQTECVETKMDGDSQIVEIIAKDFSAELSRITVYGQRMVTVDDSSIFLTGLDTVFNKSGSPNAASKVIEHNGQNYTVFDSDCPSNTWWSFAEAVNYLLCEYLPIGQIHVPSIEQLQALTDNALVRDLDVTGRSLLDALHRCCELVGVNFKFMPRYAATGPAQSIVFYRSGAGRMVELNCQPKGEQLSLSKMNFARFNSKKNFWPVTHKYIGHGDFKIYEATFELVKAWDPALEGNDYDKFSPETNPNFDLFKDVYRKWCLNEAGDYSDAPFSQGQAFDFYKVFDGDSFAQRRRRFYSALTTDSQGKSLGYFLEVSYDDGQQWHQYAYGFNVLTDECGVWLSSDLLDVEMWIAAQNDNLKFRITASVISDERLNCAISDGPTDSAISVIEHVITAATRYKYRKVSGQSIFANVSNGYGADEIDDSVGLYEFVRKKAAVDSLSIETIEVQTPYLAFDYQIGDKVTTAAQSRDLLGCRSDNRSTRWIKRVRMDFRRQYTDLRIARQRSCQL